jgi:hypothetical protein
LDQAKIGLTFAKHDPVTGKSEYNGVFHFFRRTWTEQVTTALWRGNLPRVLLGSHIGSVLALNELFNSLLLEHDKSVPVLVKTRLISGGLAGGVACVIYHPFRVAAHRLGTTSKKSVIVKDFWTYISKTSSEGVADVYAGVSVAMVRSLLFGTCQLGFFKMLQDVNPWQQEKGWKGISSSWSVVAMLS